MGAVYVSTFAVGPPGFPALLIRATAEASVVGGRTDWFAVTALFRHPHGPAIPHTAILARGM
jgi:uncharacterized membrane-anchored protein YjiN (DUF445 family)